MFLVQLAAVFFYYDSKAFAQSSAHPDSALSTILKQVEGTPIELQRVLEYALKNSTTVHKAEAAYLSAGGSLKKERGEFDPEFFFNIHYLDQKQPTASFFSGAPILATQQTSSQAGIRMSLPIGTELQVAMTAMRMSTNSSLAFLNPEYNTVGSLTIRQPLLRGFASSGRKRLTQSEQQLEALKARYDQEMINAGTTAEQLYWDLYASVRDYAVQLLTRDRARDFLKETELRTRTGLVGPNQVASAKTFLAEQELLLLERRAQFERQSDLLSAYIGTRPPLENRPFLPVDEPPDNFPPAHVDVLVTHVVRNNLDVLSARKDLESAYTLAHAAGWEALPRIDLVGSIGGNGLAGTGKEVIILNDTLPTPSSRSFSDALTQAVKRDFPQWSVGVELSVPIGLRKGSGEKDRLEALVLDAEQNVLAKTRVLEEQVHNTFREISDGKQRVEFAKEAVEAAQEQVRIGLIQFRNGRSTAFELVRLGEGLAIAQQRYSNALIRTAKAAAAMKQLTSGWYPEHY